MTTILEMPFPPDKTRTVLFLVASLTSECHTQSLGTHIRSYSNVSLSNGATKVWMAYTRHVLWALTMKNVKTKKVFTEALPKSHARYSAHHLTRIEHFILTKPLASWESPMKYNLKYPIFHLQVDIQIFKRSRRRRLDGTFNSYYKFEGSFKLVRDVALRVFIKHLRVFGVVLGHCQSYLTFQCPQLKGSLPGERICGIFSRTEYFPHASAHCVKIEADFLVPTVSFAASIIFEVWSSCVITSNTKEEHRGTLYQREFITKMLLQNSSLSNYHVATDKTKALKLFFLHHLGIEYHLFEGPGRNHLIQSQPVVVTKGFQVIVDIWASSSQDVSKTSTQFVFVSHRKEEDRRIVLPKDKQLALHLSSQYTFYRNLYLRRISIFATPGKYLNVSFQKFLFVGDNGTQCLFGGLVFHDFDKNHTELIRTICTSIPDDWKNLQNVVSASAGLFVTFYAYKSHSNIEIKLKVSQSQCKPVRINIVSLLFCNKISTHECVAPFANYVIKRGFLWYIYLSQSFYLDGARCTAIQVSLEPFFVKHGSLVSFDPVIVPQVDLRRSFERYSMQVIRCLFQNKQTGHQPENPVTK